MKERRVHFARIFLRRNTLFVIPYIGFYFYGGQLFGALARWRRLS
jgi:hypothetical protein